jgi:hypothetical protein
MRSAPGERGCSGGSAACILGLLLIQPRPPLRQKLGGQLDGKTATVGFALFAGGCPGEVQLAVFAAFVVFLTSLSLYFRCAARKPTPIFARLEGEKNRKHRKLNLN